MQTMMPYARLVSEWNGSFRLLLVVVFTALVASSGFAQKLTQTVRGTVVDAESQFPLAEATVVVLINDSLIAGTHTESSGAFSLSDIPIGKVMVKCNLLGYKERVYNNIDITSSKEIVLQILLEQHNFELDEVLIKAVREGDVANEMALISARQFSVNETDRYAGSRGDPARMASNFAGVQGADDSRNDIVIRGNSPQGVLWRMEGIDIPNPNHFSIPGTGGGPVSIINNKYLANSDFFTGAFPADYGNSISGVFDLKMRNGNNHQHEFSAQFGFLGTELFAEGPLSFKQSDSTTTSSYLASYRYSTVELFSLLGIDIGTTATPRYQDGAFRFSFPGKNNSSLSIWGIGGISSVDILISDQKDPDERNIYGENDRDQYFKSRMGVVGATFAKSFDEKSFLKSSLAFMTDRQDSYHELVFRHVDDLGKFEVDSLVPLLDYTFQQNKISSGTFVNKKINRRYTLRIGYTADLFFWNYVDSVRTIEAGACDYFEWRTRWNYQNAGMLLQPYAQLKIKASDHLTISAGLHGSFFSIFKTAEFVPNRAVTPLEPRLAARYELNKNQSLSMAIGRHSQLPPAYLYFYQPEIPACITCDSCNTVQNPQMINRLMDFTTSTHFVMSYQRIFKDFRFLAEVYYQDINNIPVEVVPSSFSLVNTGAGFTRFFPGKLKNTGTGYNTGIELTAEKFFSHGWLALITASVFDSRYKGSDGVERNTDFNGRYAANFVFSKEWKAGKNNAFVSGVKITTAGGRWYGPADEELSISQKEIVFVDSLRNTLQFDPYFRFDLKLNYRINRKKVTHEIGLDLVNLTGQQNVLKLTYAPDDVASTSDIREEYQLGFLPIFFYRIDF